jgi:hypothetical protein
MKTSWQTKGAYLVCRWSELEEGVQYSAPWIQTTSRTVLGQSVPPLVLDFARLSPFGGKEWYRFGSLVTPSYPAATR